MDPADWGQVVHRDRVTGGRMADSTAKYRRIDGVWRPVDSSHRNLYVPTGPPPPPPPGVLPPAPSGMSTFYEVDFRNIGSTLPAGWVAQSSAGGNSGGTYRPQNVAVVPGVGLVHTAERDYVGAEVFTGKVYGRINVPQFCHIRFRAYSTAFETGCWPSFWGRPQSGGNMQGEKDYLEMFGGHIGKETTYPRVFGGGFITTPYDTSANGADTVDFDSIIGQGPNNTKIPAWDEPHIYDSLHLPGQGCRMWVDNTFAGTVTKAGMSTAGSRAAWDGCFEDPTATWYLRTDLQMTYTSTTQAGYKNAGPLAPHQVGKFHKWTIEWVQIFVP